MDDVPMLPTAETDEGITVAFVLVVVVTDTEWTRADAETPVGVTFASAVIVGVPMAPVAETPVTRTLFCTTTMPIAPVAETPVGNTDVECATVPMNPVAETPFGDTVAPAVTVRVPRAVVPATPVARITTEPPAATVPNAPVATTPETATFASLNEGMMISPPPPPPPPGTPPGRMMDMDVY